MIILTVIIIIIIIMIIKDWSSFGETYEVSLQIIRSMQSSYKTCEVKLMLKNRRR